MSQYGATHRLLVEHEHEGIEDVETVNDSGDVYGTREAYVSRVLYYIEHPEDCLTPAERDRSLAERRARSAWAAVDEVRGEGRYGCPVDQEIENVGILEALGVTRHASNGGRFQWVTEHLQEGSYKLNAWYTHYSSPNGDDWDGGLEYAREPDPPQELRPAVGFELAPHLES